jgi:hemolysin III
MNNVKLKLRDPVNGLTHLAGALLSVAALVVLIYVASQQGTPWHIVSFAVFGASLILLYTASTLYHLLPLGEKGVRTLKRVDHMMIYVLIAGTYTPICLVALRGVWGWSIFAGIWTLAVLGVIMKIFWLNAPRWLSTLFYLVMGWLVVIAIPPLLKSIPPQGIFWLAAGGILYTVGAAIYGLKKPNFIRGFGFHEIFHLFVIGGSLNHFWLMYRYILYVG